MLSLSLSLSLSLCLRSPALYVGSPKVQLSTLPLKLCGVFQVRTCCVCLCMCVFVAFYKYHRRKQVQSRMVKARGLNEMPAPSQEGKDPEQAPSGMPVIDYAYDLLIGDVLNVCAKHHQAKRDLLHKSSHDLPVAEAGPTPVRHSSTTQC